MNALVLLDLSKELRKSYKTLGLHFSSLFGNKFYKTGARMIDRLFSSYYTSHCVLSLSKTLYLQLSTGSTKEDWKSFRHC